MAATASADVSEPASLPAASFRVHARLAAFNALAGTNQWTAARMPALPGEPPAERTAVNVKSRTQLVKVALEKYQDQL